VVSVEIVRTQMAEVDGHCLHGRHIDVPKTGQHVDGHVLRVVGWVLAKDQPAAAVEIVAYGKVIGRTLVDVERPDVAAAYPGIAGAARSGFSTRISLLNALPHLDLEVIAVLADQRRPTVGAIRVRTVSDDGAQGTSARVSVVIPCYNQARFLGEAIESVAAQTYGDVEAIVVDDGSTDNTCEVAGQYPGAVFVRQDNAGLAAARNTGLRYATGDYVVFLDADDRLLPSALRVGLEALLAHPECAFVFGGCRFIGPDGSALPTPAQPRLDGHHYRTLLRTCCIWAPAAVMYRRSAVEAAGGFDPSVSPSADYDLYLRLARHWPVYRHGEVVAEYRRHGANMTLNPGMMLQSELAVLQAQWPHVKHDPELVEAYWEGVRRAQDHYGGRLVRDVRAMVATRDWRPAMKGTLQLLRHYPAVLAPAAKSVVEAVRQTRLRLQSTTTPRVGRVRFGNLRRLAPISRDFGFDRGLPIDRYYIEHFLSRHSSDVRGHVLEVGDSAYTRRFGQGRVTHVDVLHVEEGNPDATVVADLTAADDISGESFDCVILTQTLQFIYETEAAVRTVWRLLRPGGVLLATVPGVSQLSRDEWADRWCWAFTAVSVRRLMERRFPAENLHVETYGNVLAAVGLLEGLAAQELGRDELDHRDPSYPVLVTVRATKPERRPAPGRTASPHHNRTRRSRGAGQAAVLMYHRVGEGATDPWSLSVSPGHLSEHLQVRRSVADPLSLRDLSGGLRNGRLPDRSVSVTFDDGYADNFEQALPLLERYHVPATVFITSGYVGAAREFWWDELDRLLLQPGQLPPVLQLEIEGQLHRWELGGSALLASHEMAQHRAWRAWESVPTARHLVYRQLWDLLRSLRDDDRRDRLDQLLDWAGIDRFARPTHRPLTEAEAVSLERSGLVHLGAHSVTHPSLSTLTNDAQQEEIVASKAAVEKLIGREVDTFAYPFGKAEDFAAATREILRKEGFSMARTNVSGLVRLGVDLLQLPRFHVEDWSGEEFRSHLEGWFIRSQRDEERASWAR